MRFIPKRSLPNVIEITKIDGKLYRRMSGEPDEELMPESTNKFFYDPAKTDIQYEFETDENGKVIKAYLISSGLKKEIKKL